MDGRNLADLNPATGPQLHLIAILSAQMHIREPVVKGFGEAGLMIRELYRERDYRRKHHAIQYKSKR